MSGLVPHPDGVVRHRWFELAAEAVARGRACWVESWRAVSWPGPPGRDDRFPDRKRQRPLTKE